MPDTLTHTQAMRYNRHIVLPQFDLEGQEKLLNSKVLILGAGGLGNTVAQLMCTGGAGTITLADDDRVEAHNLPRQILFTPEDCGKLKTEAARQRLLALVPECAIHCVSERPDDNLLSRLVESHDIVIDCTDNLASRKQINAISYRLGKPLVSGAAIRFEGQLFIIMPGSNKACYQCVEKRFSMTELSCNEAGILSPVVSITGACQAQLAMQVLTGFGTLPAGELHLFDGLTFQWQKFTVPQLPDCDICQPK